MAEPTLNAAINRLVITLAFRMKADPASVRTPLGSADFTPLRPQPTLPIFGARTFLCGRDTSLDVEARQAYLSGRASGHVAPGATMQRIKETMRNVLIGSVAAAIFVTTTYAQINDSIR